MRKNVLLVLSMIFVLHGILQSADKLPGLLRARGEALVADAKQHSTTAPAAYLRFADLVATELAKAGERATAARITNVLIDTYNVDMPQSEMAWITHTFAREYYREDIIRETSELIRFRTFATDVPNRLNPEFIRQKEYVRELAEKLGLNFRDVGGFVQEVWIGDARESFGLMSHSDVQPVDPSEWSRDPWSGEIVDGKIWGRGSVDDKGPIVAIMYGMRAMLDSGLPLKRKVILLIGTDEESANQDVATYLEKNPAPDQTIVVDSNYPVVCAEKGWCGFWLHVPRGSGNPGATGFLVTGLQAGFSPSIVPEKASARLVTMGMDPVSSRDLVEKKIVEFTKRRKNARLQVGLAGDTLYLNASGKSVHASLPDRGHNALMDLLVFLTKDLDVLPNEYGLMARFAATYIGFELNGKSLGIAHKDPFMGEVTVAANMFTATDSSVMFMFNYRIPKGIAKEKTVNAIESRMREFSKTHGFRFSDTRYISDPHYVDPNSEFVQRLLQIYNTVTAEKRQPEAIGGGTYARRLPNAVVFGPALPDEDYLGHQPDEHFLISTLLKNVEILTHAMVKFGM